MALLRSSSGGEMGIFSDFLTRCGYLVRQPSGKILSMVFAPPAAAKQSLMASTTHIPPLPAGVFSVGASSLIDAPIDKVWNILLDFQSYSEWNPFVYGFPTR